MMRKILYKIFNLDIFQDTNFTQTIPVIELEHTDASYNLEYAIGNFAEFINDNG